MPNWCNNTLTIKGKTEKVHEFLKIGMNVEELPTEAKELQSLISDRFSEDYGKTDEERLLLVSLDCFNPMPEIFKEGDTTNYPDKFPKLVKQQKEQYGCVGWYDWGCKYRGTKWDAGLNLNYYNEDEQEAELSVYFDTAWSPPVEWLHTIQEKFPELNFRLEYYEDGCCFRGVSQTEEGQIVDYYDQDYKLNYDEEGDCVDEDGNFVEDPHAEYFESI